MRQCRAFVAVTGQMDCQMVRRGVARHQIAPRFDGGLGFPDVFEERLLAVEAAPAPGLEQVCEIFQPPLSEVAPTRYGIATARHVSKMCHKPARWKKDGRRRNRDESTECDSSILWKTCRLSSVRASSRRFNQENPHSYGAFRACRSQAAQRHGHVANGPAGNFHCVK